MAVLNQLVRSWLLCWLDYDALKVAIEEDNSQTSSEPRDRFEVSDETDFPSEQETKSKNLFLVTFSTPKYTHI